MKKLFSFLFGFLFKSDREKILEKKLYDLERIRIEDYLTERMLLDTSDGFQIKFLGETIVNILAKCFWLLVKDSDNYLVFTFRNPEKNEGVDVIIVKDGYLAPLDRVEELEQEVEMLKEELRKISN